MERNHSLQEELRALQARLRAAETSLKVRHRISKKKFTIFFFVVICKKKIYDKLRGRKKSVHLRFIQRGA